MIIYRSDPTWQCIGARRRVMSLLPLPSRRWRHLRSTMGMDAYETRSASVVAIDPTKYLTECLWARSGIVWDHMRMLEADGDCWLVTLWVQSDPTIASNDASDDDQ